MAAPASSANRIGVAIRTLAGAVGGYAAATLATLALAYGLPGGRAGALLWGGTASFAVWTGAIVWAFSARSAAWAAGGIAAACLALAAGWGLFAGLAR